MAYTTIDDPTIYFNTKIYSGNGSNPRTIAGVGFQPDWVWQKNRTDSNGHTLADSVRGANKTLSSDGSGAEITNKNDGHLDAFTSDGFTVGAGSSSDARVNDGSHTYVAWNWKAGTAFTNDASSTGIGGVDSAGSFNNTAGFSIVTYNGNAGNTTVKHGMNVAPKMIFFKRRDASSTNWYTYHASVGQGKRVVLNTTAAEAADTEYMNNTAPTTSVFSLGPSGTVNTTGNHLAYCFAEIKAYSKFGGYTGNNNANGTFVYTGFKPAYVMTKVTNTTDGWMIFDNKRNPRNVMDKYMTASGAGADSTRDSIDFVSNGFKLRVANTDCNNGTYLYMAFAENPFVTSTGVPATAR